MDENWSFAFGTVTDAEWREFIATHPQFQRFAEPLELDTLPTQLMEKKVAKFKIGKPKPKVPSGSYTATFSSYEEEVSEKYGQKQLAATFKIVGGKFKDAELRYWCSLEYEGEPLIPSSSNKIGKLLNALSGKTLKEDDVVDLDKLVGNRVLLAVSETEKGFARVDSVLAPPSSDDDEQEASADDDNEGPF